MKKMQQFTAIIEKEGDLYVSLCPELDIASQGVTIEEAKANLTEAIELFFETASPSEITNRLHSEIFITRIEQLTEELLTEMGDNLPSLSDYAVSRAGIYEEHP